MKNFILQYDIRHTDPTTGSVYVVRSSVNDDQDVSILGPSLPEYGLEFNENILHLLENFSVSEYSDSVPNLNKTQGLLQAPLIGQIWFNETKSNPMVWTGREWLEFGKSSFIGGSSGVIAHGERIPLPKSPDGYTFKREECAWTVSPFGFDLLNTPSNIKCYVDITGKVFMQYTTLGSTIVENGYVNYQVVGIKNVITGVQLPPSIAPPKPSPTNPITTPIISKPKPSSTRTIVRPSLTPTKTPRATPTPTVTRSGTPISTPNPSVTRTQTPVPTPTPTITPSITPTRFAPVFIDVPSITIKRTTTLSKPIRVSYSLLSNGYIVIGDDSTVEIPTLWITGEATVFYSVRATGNNVNGSEKDTWLNLGSDRSWYVDSLDIVGTTYIGFEIEIRRNSDLIIMRKAQIKFEITTMAG